MDRKLRIHYDVLGDVLYLERCPPYAEQDSDEVASGIVTRTNPDSGEIETVEILFYSSRPLASLYMDLPEDLSLDFLVREFAQQQQAA